MSWLPAVKAEVVTALTIAFREGDVTICHESRRGVARGGQRVGSLIVVVTTVGAFLQVVVPMVLGLGVAFCGGRARLACEVLGLGARPPFRAPGWNGGKAVGVANCAPSLISSLWVSQKCWS